MAIAHRGSSIGAHGLLKSHSTSGGQIHSCTDAGGAPQTYRTVNTCVLLATPFGVVTAILPVLAPLGTVA